MSAPKWAELLRVALENHAADMRVALPARVERYDATKQSVDVVPLLKDTRPTEDGAPEVVDLPVIPGVPLAFPGAGGYRVTFPVKPGDTVLLVFADRSMEVWKARGGVVDPEDARSHHLADAVAIPGLRPFSAPLQTAPTDGATIGADAPAAPRATFTETEIQLAGASDAVALASKVLAQLEALKTAINGWTPVPGDGGAALKAALSVLFATWPQSVASAKVKAE